MWHCGPAGVGRVAVHPLVKKPTALDVRAGCVFVAGEEEEEEEAQEQEQEQEKEEEDKKVEIAEGQYDL